MTIAIPIAQERISPLLDAAARLLTDVATFGEAAVSTADR